MGILLSMNEIVASVQRVSDLIGEITASSAEQRDGIAQVNQAVGNLDQMTQQNAALVEESAAAAQSLREQADHLAQVVSMFNVGAGAASSSAPAHRAPQPSALGAGAVVRAAQGRPQAPLTRSAVAGAGSAPAARLAPAPRVPAKAAVAHANDDWESF